MNEWKIVALASLVANVILLGLFVSSLLLVKNMIYEKDREILSLNSTIKEFTITVEQSANEQIEVSDEGEQIVIEDVVAQKESIEKIKKEEISNDVNNNVNEVSSENKTTNLKKYEDAIRAEYGDIYFSFEGVSLDLLYEEYDNATIESMFNNAYVQADKLLNKMYTILKNELSPGEFAKLQQEQRQWLNSLEQSKKNRASMGGSAESIDITINLFDATKKRCGVLVEKYFGGYFGQ